MLEAFKLWIGCLRPEMYASPNLPESIYPTTGVGIRFGLFIIITGSLDEDKLLGQYLFQFSGKDGIRSARRPVISDDEKQWICGPSKNCISLQF